MSERQELVDNLASRNRLVELLREFDQSGWQFAKVIDPTVRSLAALCLVLRNEQAKGGLKDILIHITRDTPPIIFLEKRR